jgi:hypothetical protein
VVKPATDLGDEYGVEVGPYDMHEISRQEAMSDALVFVTLTWGGQRDQLLIRKLEGFESVGTLVERGAFRKRWGIVRGNRRKPQPICDRPILDTTVIPDSQILTLDSTALPMNTDPWTDSSASTDLSLMLPY